MSATLRLALMAGLLGIWEASTRLLHVPALYRLAKIYADSFGKDASFYDFYRAMKSYETSFVNPTAKGGTTIVLSPNNDYLRQFQGKK